MRNTLKLNFEECLIVMDRTFAKNAENTRSEEYAHLQEVRRDYPEYSVITRTIKRNLEKETYKGLTYEYMEDYILRHETEEKQLAIIKEFNELRTISKCHKSFQRVSCLLLRFVKRLDVVLDDSYVRLNFHESGCVVVMLIQALLNASETII